MPGSLTTPGRSGACDGAPVCIAFHVNHRVGTRDNLSRLNGWPMHSPTDASPTPSRAPAHGSGPMWVKARSRGELGTAWQRRYGDFDINPELVCGRDADPPEASTARLVDSRAASGREAAVRIAERFHNFCAPARMLQKNGDFIFLASVISNSCAWKNVAEIAHFTIVARLIRRAAFCGMGVDQFPASRV
jgi:hypothetical protein